MHRLVRRCRLGWLVGLVVVALLVGRFVWFRGTHVPVDNQEVAVLAESPEDRIWQECVAALEAADRSLNEYEQVRLRFWKQERIGENLGPICLLEAKQRRDPLSIYLRWIEPAACAGREVIFEEGKRGGKMIAHEGGILQKFAPTLLLEVDGTIAHRVSSYTLPETAIWGLNRRSLERVRKAGSDQNLKATKKSVTVRGREATCYELAHAPGGGNDFGYHKLVVYVDHQLMIPTRWEKYALPPPGAGDKLQLLEYIEFDVPDFQPMLDNDDFNPANSRYGF